MNRWLPVVGGVTMNLALGTFYAMSVFLLPLEKEFGWTRAQTSWVTTIGIGLIAAWYVVAGWIFQFVGHAYERKPPEFLKDWRFLFVGLRWWMAKMRGRA